MLAEMCSQGEQDFKASRHTPFWQLAKFGPVLVKRQFGRVGELVSPCVCISQMTHMWLILYITPSNSRGQKRPLISNMNTY